MIQIIEGNLLDATENIICHQVNCMGVMGSGVALQIRNKWPNVYYEYVDYVHKIGNNTFGTCHIVPIGFNKYVANLFGQYSFGTSKRQTDYRQLGLALDMLLTMGNVVKKNKNNLPWTYAFPEYIGCGLAGGDWNIVQKMIEEKFANESVTIYRYTP